MARIRTIKVDLFVDDSLADVSVEAHLLLAGLPCIADSAGRLEDRPKRIHALLMPYRHAFDVSARLDELQAVGAVLRYEVGGVRYLQVANWDRDQRPHVKEAESVIPASPPGYTEHRKGSELAGNSPGTRPSEPAGNREYGLGVLDLGSGFSSAVAPAPQRPKAAKKPKSPDKPTDPRHAPLVKALVEEQGWELGGGRGAKAVTALLAAADEAPATRGEAAPAEVLRRAANALEKRRVAPAAFPAVAALWELAQHWAHFATAPSRATGPPVSQAHVGGHDDSRRECAGCGANGVTSGVGEPQVFLGYECGCLGAFMTDLQQGLHFTKAQEWARKRRAA